MLWTTAATSACHASRSHLSWKWLHKTALTAPCSQPSATWRRWGQSLMYHNLFFEGLYFTKKKNLYENFDIKNKNNKISQGRGIKIWAVNLCSSHKNIFLGIFSNKIKKNIPIWKRIFTIWKRIFPYGIACSGCSVYFNKYQLFILVSNYPSKELIRYKPFLLLHN